ncbi:hypothetical protein ACOMHN_045971 [Nucella lapillus]
MLSFCSIPKPDVGFSPNLMIKVAMGTGRAAQCLGVVLTVMAAGSHLTQGAPAYSTRPVRAPPCPHATHTSLCWTVRLKSPLHFHLTPATDERPLPPQDSAHPAGSTEDGHFYPKTSALTNQPSALTNQPTKSNSGALLSEKVGHGSARSAGTEVSRSQKAYVYHQMALQLADEVGLSLLGKVGELYDHFVLCHEDLEPDADTRSRHANPDAFRESGKAFQSYHKAHAVLLKVDAATYDEIRNQAEGSLHRHPDVAWFSMETVHHRQKRAVVFNDPAFPNQWHLVNHVERGMDINVTGVWERGVTGKGVTVAVVDDVSNHHGTRCAGEIAAVPNNQVCGVGVAYGSKVSGIRVLDGPMTDSLEAEAFNKKFDINAIYSCSWGPDDDGKTVDGPHILAAKAMKYGIEFGRHGYGSIFVVASGNGGSKQDNCNYDGYANSIYTVTIGAVDESGAMPFYAEECASMLGVTFSSGIASKRDIIDRDLAHWHKNAAGLEHSHKHGFGLISAWRMVNAARVWRSVPWMTSYSEEETGDWSIPRGPSNHLIVSHTVMVKDIAGYSLYMLEYVQLTLTLTHPFRGKLDIRLRCPSGTESVIGANRPLDNNQEKRVHPVNAQTTPDTKHSPAFQRPHHPVTRTQQTVQQPRMTSPQTNHEPPSSSDHPRPQHHCVSPSPKMTTPADNPRPRPHCAPPSPKMTSPSASPAVIEQLPSYSIPVHNRFEPSQPPAQAKAIPVQVTTRRQTAAPSQTLTEAEISPQTDYLIIGVYTLHEVDQYKMNTEISELKAEQNDHEQHGRLWNVRVFGLKETEGETVGDCVQKVVEVITSKLGVAVQPEEVEMAHRSGKPMGPAGASTVRSRPRPILVRFHSRQKKKHTGITPGRRLGSEKDAPVPQSRAHQREQPEEPVGCLRGLLIRGARRLPPEFCDVRSPTSCLSIILYERGYSSCIRSIGERVPRPGPQYASDGVSTVSADCTKVFRQ